MRALHITGLSGMYDNMPYTVYARIHYVIGTIGIIGTEMFAVSFKIEELREQRIAQTAALGMSGS